MRSVVGAIWPFLRPREELVLLPDFFAVFFAAELFAAVVVLDLAALWATARAESADTPDAAATSSARARCVAVRGFMLTWLRSAFAGSPFTGRCSTALHRAGRRYGYGHYP